MFLHILYFLIACYVLIQSGTWVVKSLIRISRSLRLGYFLVSFILMAFFTSLPELLIALSSAFKGLSVVSLGNVIGSNICNLGLILGIATLFVKGIKAESKLVKNDVLYMTLIGLLPLLLILDGSLSRLDGLILLFSFLIYFSIVMRERRAFEKLMDEGFPLKGCFLNLFLFILAVFLLIISAHFVVDYGVLIAKELHVSLFLISLFLIALGTSLPELVFTLKTIKEKEEMTLGNLIGSTVVNASLILGLSALISPIEDFDFLSFSKSTVFLVIIFLIFMFDVRSRDGLRWPTGIFLILLYLIFLLVEFL